MIKLVFLLIFTLLIISGCGNDKGVEDNLSINISDNITNESLELIDDQVNDSLDNETIQIDLIVSCVDSDGGKDYSDWGYIRINNSDKEYVDACNSDVYIREYYCNNESQGNLAFEVYACPDICEDGECTSSSANNETNTTT